MGVQFLIQLPRMEINAITNMAIIMVRCEFFCAAS